MVKIVSRLIIVIALAASSRSFAVERPSDIPGWLRPNVGEGEAQIAQVVLQRARALYFQKVRAGVVSNPCYFAMDATRPHDLGDGKLGPRFYVICESRQSFRAISAGHGGGRFEGYRGFRQREAVREELRQCIGFETDGRWGLRNRPDDNVFQRLLSRLSRQRRDFDTLVRAV